jgi:hypothetical protein
MPMPNPTTATATTIPQPLRALGVANTHRSAAAVLKTRLRQRTVSLREILEDPPAELERQMTWEVLLWAPGIGRTRLRALNARAMRQGHVNLAAPLGALTERQRQWLTSQLPGSR